ncbi:MAG: PTS system mannose/fructose/sorbose family transporter subunit IID [Candidatus Goldbacteria bacterium]|nr:PTS system mannose/fructose/sorbose family transporter subunit IID [Candidatus Goldiibacteriota bacterium]HPD18134.1 PTS system mannose/fructose/sorbose family transporter subunit IID [Candidatus Goldiibacteriota bacterium]
MKAGKYAELLWAGIKLNFLQTSWNFERLQNIGFLSSFIHILKRIYKNSKENFLLAIKRHVGFFNTHIFFASAVLGVMTKLEEEISDDNPEAKEKEIEGIKTGIMGPLAAIGDSLFWSGIKPLSLLIGVGIIWLYSYDIKVWLIASIISVLIYNVPRVLIKYYLLFKSYFQYKEVFLLIQKIRFQDIMKSIKIIGMGILGFVTAGYLNFKDKGIISNKIFESFVLILFFVFIVRALKSKISVSTVFLSVIIGSIIFSYIIVR